MQALAEPRRSGSAKEPVLARRPVLAVKKEVVVKRALLLLLACLLLLIPAAATAVGEIVASSSAEANFPVSLTFTLSARSSADITDIVLRYRIDRLSVVPVTSMVEPDFTPGPVVETSWTWETAKLGGMPPGAEVEYSWLVEDAAGRVLEAPPQRVVFADERHPWQSLGRGGVSLYWYQGLFSFAEELLAAAVEAKDRLARDIGVELGGGVEVFIYGSAADLQAALIHPQGWEGGVAYSDYGTIVLGVAPSNLAWGKRTLAHELAHLVVHQLTFNPYSFLPTWLDEGLAMYAEGDLLYEMGAALDVAIGRDELISVRSLASSFPADEGQARLSYAESHSLVQFLLGSFGKGKMLELLSVLSRGTTADDALLEVYGVDTEGLEKLWRTDLGLPPTPATPAVQDGVPLNLILSLGLAAAVFLALFLVFALRWRRVD